VISGKKTRSTLPYNMDSMDSFNDFILNELNDSSSSDDDEFFYFDAAEIVANTLVDEPIRRGSIIGHRTRL
jgi:hypothetical protein